MSNNCAQVVSRITLVDVIILIPYFSIAHRRIASKLIQSEQRDFTDNFREIVDRFAHETCSTAVRFLPVVIEDQLCHMCRIQ